MYIMMVPLKIKPDQLEAFKRVVLENARASIQEPGIARFDVLQQNDDPTRFMLVEVYRTPEDAAKHRETPHYKKWGESIPDLLAEPRTRVFYTNVYPDDQAWG